MLSSTRHGNNRSVLAQFFAQSFPKNQYKKFSSGELLFEENKAALGCHVIQKGRVALSVACFDGSRTEVERVGAGGLVGVSAAFAGRKYVATARALSDTETIYVSRRQVIRSLQTHPKMRMLILASLSQSVQQAIKCSVARRFANPTWKDHRYRQVRGASLK